MKVSKSATFLFELMIVILVFSIASAICISIFAKGFQFSAESENLTRAVINAESAAELFKDNPIAAKNEEIYYDENWKEIKGKENASFSMTLTPSSEGDLYKCDIEIFKYSEKENIYSIEVAKFQPAETVGS